MQTEFRSLDRTSVTVRAYAKLNLALEVVGRRSDGFHEIVSVTHSISLHDVVQVIAAEPWDCAITVDMAPPLVDPADDLAGRAATLFIAAAGSAGGARIRIRKRIPLAAGLGGASADAAAVLHGLNRLWQTGLNRSELARMGAELGSDVPFSLRIGGALVQGRGERVDMLSSVGSFWVVLACPKFSIPGKTAAMYAALDRSDWSGGSRCRALAERMMRGESPVGEQLVNSFDRVADAQFAGFAELRARLGVAAGSPLHLTGSGPTLFGLFQDRSSARAAAARMAPCGVRCMVARSVGR